VPSAGARKGSGKRGKGSAAAESLGVFQGFRAGRWARELFRNVVMNGDVAPIYLAQ
jgi:hypothetical protein